MKKEIAIGLIGLTVLSAAAAGVYAFAGFGKGILPGRMNDAALQEALENKDFNAYKSALTEINGNAVSRITEEQFSRIADNYKSRKALDAAIQANDFDAYLETLSNVNSNLAEKVTEERFADLVEKYNQHEAVETAIENSDYQAWINAVLAMPHGSNMADIVSEEDFNKLVEMHKARELGDFEAAKAIADDLGIGIGRGKGLTHGGMGNGPEMRENCLDSKEGKHKGLLGFA